MKNFIKNFVIFIETMILSILAGGVAATWLYNEVLYHDGIETHYLKRKH